MNRRTLHMLLALVVGLVLLLLVLERGERSPSDGVGGALLPGFADVANEASRIQVVRAAGETGVTIRRGESGWVVSARDDYPADIVALRQLVGGLAEARIVETKTADPARYERLGVGDPNEGGNGTRFTVSGTNFEYSVVIGDAAGSDQRYVRLSGEPQSVLVDQALAVPASVEDWLLPGIVDISADRVERVVIEHADGETITLERTGESESDFTLSGVPEGRELKYASIGDPVAGALDGLELEDVRKAADAPTDSSARFETRDGLVITAAFVTIDGERWLEVSAESAADNDEIKAEADRINQRVDGWQYQVADTRSDRLARRWDDLLQPVDDE